MKQSKLPLAKHFVIYLNFLQNLFLHLAYQMLQYIP